MLSYAIYFYVALFLSASLDLLFENTQYTPAKNTIEPSTDTTTCNVTEEVAAYANINANGLMPMTVDQKNIPYPMELKIPSA